MYNAESRKIFRQWVSQGNKLSFEELQELKNESWKIDYITHQLLEDDVVKDLLHQQKEQVEKEYEKIAEVREEATDTSQFLTNEKKAMALKLQKRMVELGLTKKRTKTTKIQEFQIRDMIILERKKWCKTCLNCLKCSVHGLQRMGKRQNKLYNEERIDRLFQPQMRKGQFSQN